MEETETLELLFDFLKEYTNNNRRLIVGILNPLKTEIMQKEMYNYLIENRSNPEMMTNDVLLEKTLAIAGVFPNGW